MPARDLLALANSEGVDAERLRDGDEVRIVGQVDLAIVLVEEQLLPLAHQTQRRIVEQHDLQRDAVALQRRQLLDVHHEASRRR